jgi:hypothetical protein
LLVGFGEDGIDGGELGGEGAVDGIEIELVPGGEDSGRGKVRGGGAEEFGGLLLAFEGAGDEEVAGVGLRGEVFAEAGGLAAAEGERVS